MQREKLSPEGQRPTTSSFGLIDMQIPARPQPFHDLIYVDNLVVFGGDSSWTTQRTGYAGVLPIRQISDISLISRPYGDRSPIHSPYDYE